MYLVFAAVALAGFMLAIFAGTPLWVGLGLLIGFACAIIAVFALVGSRIDARSRSEDISDAELELLRANMRAERERPKPPAP